MERDSNLVQYNGHFPQQAAISAYGNGGFRFAEMSHKGSLLCLPNGIFSWDVTKAEQITEKTLQPVFDNAAEIDVLLIGMGEEIGMLDPSLREILRQHNIVAEGTGTGGAVRTYNVLLSENRAVAAALISVERDSFLRNTRAK